MPTDADRWIKCGEMDWVKMMIMIKSNDHSRAQDEGRK